MLLHMNHNFKLKISTIAYLVGISGFLVSVSLILSSNESSLAKATGIGTTSSTAIAALVAGSSITKQKEKESWEEAVGIIVRELQKGTSTELITERLAPFLSTRTKEKVLSISKSIQGYLDRVHLSDELYNYLEDKKTKKLLLDLAHEATEQAFEGNSENQRLLWQDIYKYLRNWLKNSLRYETLPDIVSPLPYRSINDNYPYIQAFAFLRDKKLDAFLNSSYAFKFPKLALKEILYEYLDVLVKEFSKGEI